MSQTTTESAKKEDEQGQGRNSNNRRFTQRRARRRRPSRNETDTPIADDTGNKLPPEKKEVDGNALKIDDAPLPNGNVIDTSQEIEVDGNKPAPAAKPQRKSTSNNPRRRRPSTRQRQEKSAEAITKARRKCCGTSRE